MKKIFIYFAVVAFACFNVFGSCEKKKEHIKKAKHYLTRYDIYDNIDSSYTKLTVYVGEIDGHKYRYHLFNGKNKSQLIIEHPAEECKKCLNRKK